MASKVPLNGVALVTGAAKGIGKETAISFAEAGARAVVFADIEETGAQAAVEESKKFAKHAEYRALAVKVDITEETSVNSMVETTVKEFGRIDYFVNSAGITNLSEAATVDLQLDIYEKTMATNTKGTMLCCRAVSKAMAEQEPLSHESRHGRKSLGRGSIVVLGSLNSYIGVPGMLPYTASKHAVIGITKSAAIDNMKAHIRVNAVCPSWTATPMHEHRMQRVKELADFVKAVSPVGREATTEEVADYIVFLSSPSGSYINGTALIIDAGLSLTGKVG